MAITFDSQTFPGACQFYLGGTVEAVKLSRVVGTDGKLVLKLGGADEGMSQEGVLVTKTASSMRTLISNIKAKRGVTGSLTDHYGTVYSNTTLVTFRPGQVAKRAASQVTCMYRCTYEQSGA